MKQGLYRKLALNGIKNNKQLYIPYFIMGMCVISIYYILDALSRKQSVAEMSTTLVVVLYLGMYVIFFFSITYMLYVNSFLIKRRLKEFGLYNVLGMDKKNLSKILLWENAISAGVCIAGGLAVGMLLEKFSEVCLLRFVDLEVTYGLTFEFSSVIRTIVFYAILFIIILLRSLRAVKKTNPIELVKNESMGEKPVKANWVLAVLGVVILAVAYYIAVRCRTTITAITCFFIAVGLVILATDLLFVSGSVALCKFLKSRKGYYYKAKHFVSVSSMTYRMKRNGAGLAVICILATMVMVMITGSGCLFFGKEDSIARQYPRDCHIVAYLDDVNAISDESLAEKTKTYEAFLTEKGVDLSTTLSSRYLESDGIFENGVFHYDDNYGADTMKASEKLEKSQNLYILSIEDYNALTGKSDSLASDEIIIYCTAGKYKLPTFEFEGLKTFKVKENPSDFPYVYSKDSELLFNSICIVVDSYSTFAPMVFSDVEISTKVPVRADWYYGWNMSGAPDTYAVISEAVESISEEIRWNDGSLECTIGDVATEKAEFFSMYGGLFFIGILLSIVFIVATVLIIYYKQITEGFEDQKRFEIMQKVGMTKNDIKKSINSQMLTVFFFPPFLAVVHLSFAMPMMFEMLKLFHVNNVPLLIGIAAVCVTIFAIGYITVYKLTSNTYYRIVSGKRA